MNIILNERGIETASPFVADVASVFSAAIRIDSNKDGKVSIAEGLVFGQTVIVVTMKHYATINDAIADLGDANSDERKELIRVFSVGFDLDNDTTELLIEDTIAYLEATATGGFDLVSRWQTVFAKPEA